MTRILTRTHVEGLLTIREVIDAVELAHADLANQLAIQPAPSTLSFDPSDSAVLPMAARAKRQGLSVVKLLSDIPNNAARGLPVQRSVIVLVSEATGACERSSTGKSPRASARLLQAPSRRAISPDGTAVSSGWSVPEISPLNTWVRWLPCCRSYACWFGRGHIRLSTASSSA
jgi:hypothetical protein